MDRETIPVYVLHGVAARDEDELVCQFFATIDDLEEFRKDLPGRYNTLILTGADYDTLKVDA